MTRLSEKAEKLRRLGLPAVDCAWNRPALGTLGLTISDEGFDEQFVDQLLGGTCIEEVRRNRERWLDLVEGERGQ